MPLTGAGFWQRALRLWQRPPDTEPEPELPIPGEMPGIRIGGFALVRTVAQGSFGELHLATDPASGLPVALKTVRFAGHDLTRERFLAESAAAARLSHESIVATYASGIDGLGDAAYGWIAMEWVSGHDLSRYASSPWLLPERLALELLARVADGLAHAHAQGVIHRDLKPSNILVNLAQNVVKIADFGCARLSDADRSRSGVMLGSPVYMAPEQVLGGAIDGRCDLYALSALAWQLFTGRPPLEATSLAELLQAIVHRPPDLLSSVRPDLPPLLSDILQRGLSKSPADRQRDASHWARELRLVAATLPPTRNTPDAPPLGLPRHND
ncbi:serine/threonine protein kinase [Ideonella sp. 4Y11]|uniref:Serine/threonine protein kinase n=1 Tax=Ideonella aquatica TaxID=2824119 RepID=A0A940YS60_9BURK|nr:serine/threonine-protein kinase [Ideonella aquatica]MBQ0960953.1 serine/threonine protein kinase [Ideonella aquatica]